MHHRKGLHIWHGIKTSACHCSRWSCTTGPGPVVRISPMHSSDVRSRCRINPTGQNRQLCTCTCARIVNSITGSLALSGSPHRMCPCSLHCGLCPHSIRFGYQSRRLRLRRQPSRRSTVIATDFGLAFRAGAANCDSDTCVCTADRPCQTVTVPEPHDR